MDIKSAHLKEKGFNREIYVRPPREASARGDLFKFQADAYGLVVSIRLCYLTSIDALTVSYWLKRSTNDKVL